METLVFDQEILLSFQNYQLFNSSQFFFLLFNHIQIDGASLTMIEKCKTQIYIAEQQCLTRDR